MLENGISWQAFSLIFSYCEGIGDEGFEKIAKGLRNANNISEVCLDFSQYSS